MDYEFNRTDEVFNKLLTHHPQRNLNLKVLDQLDFKNSQKFSNFAYFLYCSEKALTLDHPGLQRILQFFILSAYKNFKYGEPNHDNEVTALKYAIKAFMSFDQVGLGREATLEQKESILKVLKETKYQKEAIMSFYRKMEVLSDSITVSSPIKIHKNLLEEAKKNLEESITSFVKESIITESLKEKLGATDLKSLITNPFQKKKSQLEQILDGKSYEEYYLSFMRNENLSKKDKYQKMIQLFSLVKEEKAKDFKLEIELETLIEYHFEDKFKFRSLEIAHDTEKLIEEYIPKWINLVTLLGDGNHTKEIIDSLTILNTYCKKINDYYLTEIKREMNIFKNFLKAKVNGINS